MTEKERRVSMLNEDLQAGRVKLPTEDYEFYREWKEPADAMAYAATAKRSGKSGHSLHVARGRALAGEAIAYVGRCGTTTMVRSATPGVVHHSCALCGVLLQLADETGMALDAAMEAHHAVCSKRPIEVGDYVRWEFKSRDTWAEGEVLEVHRNSRGLIGEVAILVRSESGGFHVCDPPPMSGQAYKFGMYGCALSRIPRPAAALATAHRVFPRGADRSQRCPTCSRMFGEHFGVACESPRLEGYEVGPICAPGCQCGAHAPAPALVDGLDREQCLARWMENRLAVEGRAVPPNTLTPAQIAIGRALWLERYGAARSVELRAKVAAGREAERNRVTYSELDAED